MVGTTSFTLIDGFRTIGDMPIILSQEYHPDQLWFPFTTGFIFKELPALPPALNISRRKIQGRVSVGSNHRAPYIYEEGVEQRVLPFIEFKKVSNVQRIDLIKAKWPGWDRGGGELLTLKSKEREWFADNCCGRYAFTHDTVVFERETDYVFAKLAMKGH